MSWLSVLKMSYVVLFIFLTHGFWVGTGVHGAVKITSEPTDAHVMEGNSAYFNCSYTGTSDLPVWIINDIYYIIGSYPPRHEYSSINQFLEIYNTQLTDNGTTYQCRLVTKLSQRATLFVHKFVSAPSEGVSTESTTPYTQREPLILFSSNTDKANSSEAFYCCSNNYTWIVTGTIVSVAVGLMGVLVLTVVMIVIKKSKKDKKIDEYIEPYYEQIPAQKVHEQASEKELPITVQNMAYGQLQMFESVQMNGNACYDYCGAQNKMNSVLESNDTLNFTEGAEGKSKYM